ncbi:hypothetical protein VB796_02050 [Arcicella sp. LKC2W]|uniref:hypothetical protein n=1 Tax=Arcicella sp. LKC2W TaxID=2984198 RepID=UPI002B1EB64A|nr:hypothetical protein [Arcicella sp. LKC2W]MEA5457801.1 hypothetical protein [Arcicella sp. LKC2W]
MIEITVSPNDRPSSKRAIAFAKELMANKKEMMREAKEDFKKPEFQEMLKKLREINER